MPLNRRSADDASVDGFMFFRGWAQEFMEQWNEPLIKLEQAKRADQAIAAFEAMPEELRRQLQQQYPEQYSAAEKTYQRLKAGKDVQANAASAAGGYATGGERRQ